MKIIGDNTCVTSIRPKGKIVYCRGEQHKYWLEFQFVDENNHPVTGLNVRLEYHPLATAEEVAMWNKYGGNNFDPTPPPNPPAGITDSQGRVRFDDLFKIAVDVKTDGQQLADIMEQRPLGVRRNPNSQPVSGNAFRRETRDKNWRTDLQTRWKLPDTIIIMSPLASCATGCRICRAGTRLNPRRFTSHPGRR